MLDLGSRYFNLNMLGIREGALCDVVLVTPEGEIPAHRVVLAAASPYFHTMFCAPFAERDRERIQINGVEPFILAVLVE
jgi:hypothetical protein